MSIKTTHSVTREFAIEVIREKLENLEDLSDYRLEYLLEEVVHNMYYNFWIVPEDMLDSEPFPITSMSDIPEDNY